FCFAIETSKLRNTVLKTVSSSTVPFQGCECVYHVPSLLFTMFPLTQCSALRGSARAEKPVEKVKKILAFPVLLCYNSLCAM
ncbi:MAG: hypothetical protein IJK63_07720, partial [Oscillospiraceae bacterium]|nr:hypothetical protein [Oscillospiraceae bacterium]